jgi:hypothetical protein
MMLAASKREGQRFMPAASPLLVAMSIPESGTALSALGRFLPVRFWDRGCTARNRDKWWQAAGPLSVDEP